ncbi:polysaccharide biosynthesis protein [Mucilaginibacter sp.]|uniref:polysaccharide biosynthesis protein n=1 Tax=Mucilaginibacter sp. TaxID=1882438 RepID=UPI002843F058|nr:polysaccharide biosynthesis protein [Mucilaginibacter sp.]MDR3697547.1 polysaccharide biosynthesis protein [Mucilaginibacter sp.]
MGRIVQVILNGKPHFSKVVEWGKLIAITGFGQVTMQGIALISGIIIIRLLPTKEYALYTLANAMLGTMVVLADSGVSTAVMSQSSKVWQDRQKLGVVVVTGLKLRKKFGIISLTVMLPVLFYLLLIHGSNLLFAMLTLLAIIPSFFAALSDSLMEIVLKLHQDITKLQVNQVSAGLGRLAMISLSILAFPFTFVAIIGNGVPRIWANNRLRKISSQYADYKQQPDSNIENEMIVIVKRSLPEIIYYCLSGQITIWLISFLGSTKSVAQLGALGRLSVVITLFGALSSILIVPRFSRLKSDCKILLSHFIKILIFIFILCFFIIGVAYFFPSQILWILGKKYAGLDNYLILSFIAACLSLVIGVAFSLYASRGWIINPLFSIPFNIGVLVLGIMIFDVSTLRGVLIFNIFIGIMQAVMHIIYPVIKILKLKTGVPIDINP